jgi:hypothetical protein
MRTTLVRWPFCLIHEHEMVNSLYRIVVVDFYPDSPEWNTTLLARYGNGKRFDFSFLSAALLSCEDALWCIGEPKKCWFNEPAKLQSYCLDPEYAHIFMNQQQALIARHYQSTATYEDVRTGKCSCARVNPASQFFVCLIGSVILAVAYLFARNDNLNLTQQSYSCA